MNPIPVFATLALAVLGGLIAWYVNLYLGLFLLTAAILTAVSLKMANTWQKFVVLRAGKLQGVKGPGLFWIIPVIDNVVAVIDERIQTTGFNAEQALTRDTVPVNVDAIIFWRVHDARQAALEITDYRMAIDRVAQTSLREMIGSLDAGRPAVRPPAPPTSACATTSARRPAAWGVTVMTRRDPRRRHPRSPAGRHVAPGPGRAREAGPGDPGLGRGRGGRPVRRGRRRPTTAIPRPCSCGP